MSTGFSSRAGTRRARTAFIALAIGGLLLEAVAQPVYYPSRGQSGTQQNKDRGECGQWAQKTTGINPATFSQPVARAEKQPAVGGGERVAGAARGAVIGGALGGNAGEGAAVGAVVGGARARRNRDAEQQASNQQAQGERNSQISTYERAVSACMSGRGYTTS